MTNETLEEIFWKEGKFVNKNGKEVNPKMISLPKIIYSDNYQNFMNDLFKNLDFNDCGANAFLRGKANVYTKEINRLNYEPHHDCAVILYKI